MTTQILYDKELFDTFDNTDDVIKDYLPIDGANERRTPELNELNDDINGHSRIFFSRIRFKKNNIKYRNR